MLDTQVKYWQNVETARANRVKEAQRDTELKILQYEADINKQNADTNVFNADTNRLNYGVNYKNAITNARNAATNAYNATINEYNAITKRAGDLGTLNVNDYVADPAKFKGSAVGTYIRGEAAQTTAETGQERLKIDKDKIYAEIDKIDAEIREARAKTTLTHEQADKAAVETELLRKQLKVADISNWSDIVNKWTKSMKDLGISIDTITKLAGLTAGGAE